MWHDPDAPGIDKDGLNRLCCRNRVGDRDSCQKSIDANIPCVFKGWQNDQ